MKLLKIFLLSLVGSAFIVMTSPAAAVSSSQTNQYYSVVFDKEQEAAVVAKLTYYNTGKDEIKNLQLVIPGTTVRIISVVQEQTTSQTKTYCKRYDYNSPLEQNGERKCLEYDQATNSDSYNYVLLDASNISNDGQFSTLDLELKKTITSQQASTVILSYKTKGLASPVWNGYKYNFQTIKSPYDIDNVRVAINVADELYLKETAKSETNYQENDISEATPMLSTMEFKASAPLSRTSNYIQTSPGVVKETKSLDPNENFSVEGKYYNNSWMGELPTIIGVGATFLIIIIVLMIIIKSEKKKG